MTEQCSTAALHASKVQQSTPTCSQSPDGTTVQKNTAAGVSTKGQTLLVLQTYLYMRFPSETITRSGYQIRRKHYAVAATVKGTVYCCGARYAAFHAPAVITHCTHLTYVFMQSLPCRACA